MWIGELTVPPQTIAVDLGRKATEQTKIKKNAFLSRRRKPLATLLYELFIHLQILPISKGSKHVGWIYPTVTNVTKRSFEPTLV